MTFIHLLNFLEVREIDWLGLKQLMHIGLSKKTMFAEIEISLEEGLSVQTKITSLFTKKMSKTYLWGFLWNLAGPFVSTNDPHCALLTSIVSPVKNQQEFFWDGGEERGRF